MCPGGQSLRLLREQLGLTMRDVETASTRIAQKHGNDEFAIPPSRLSDIETKGVVPNIFRFYSFATIYRRDIFSLIRLGTAHPVNRSKHKTIRRMMRIIMVRLA